jgi:hypothetical protein
MAVTSVASVTLDRGTEALVLKKVDVTGYGQALVGLHTTDKRVDSMAVASIPIQQTLTRLPLYSARNVDGLRIATTGVASGAFLYALTPGTANTLTGHDAKNAAATDTTVFTAALPNGYVAGDDVSVIVNTSVTGSGTLGACTLTASVYRVADTGAHSANLCTTTAPTLAAAATDHTFTVTGTTLSPGDLISTKLVMLITETADTTINGVISGVRLAV